MSCMKDCYEGTNYAKRNIKTEGSLEYITIMAQHFANSLKEDTVIYIRNVTGYGKFYDFEPKASGKEDVVKCLRFNRKVVSTDVLSDNGKRKLESAKPKKQKSKPKKVKSDLGKD